METKGKTPRRPGLVAAGLIAAAALLAPAGRADARYMELGHGVYGDVHSSPGALLEYARFDWVYIPHGTPAGTAATINAILRYNPGFKVVYSLRPNLNLGTLNRAGMASCLDYWYRDGVREEIHRRVAETVRGRELITNPEAVYGWVFYEEMPMYLARPGSRDWIEPYREQIEQEMGRPFEHGPELDAWIMKNKYVPALEAIHRQVHQLHPEAVIFYHHHPNQGTVGFEFSDLVGKPWCPGLVAHLNTWGAYLDWVERAEQLEAVYFTQLSHPPGMRSFAWERAREAATEHDKSDRNLGYFLYCEGNCNIREGCPSSGWNHIKDPAVLTEKPVPGGRRLHLARFCTQAGIGTGVVERYYRENGLEIKAEAAFLEARAGDVIPLRLTVTNRREAMHFTDPEEAVAREVAVILNLPRGLEDEEGEGRPRSGRNIRRAVPDLEPLESAVLDWNLRVLRPPRNGVYPGFSATVECRGTDPLAVDISASTLPMAAVHEFSGGQGHWLEPSWEDQPVRRTLVLRAAGGEVGDIRILAGGEEIIVGRNLFDGEELHVLPGGELELFPEELCAGTGLVDDPDRARVFDDGYHVWRFNVGRACHPGRRYRLRITGRARDGGGALVTINFTGAPARHLLHGALAGDGWQEAEAIITPPDGATGFGRIDLWRYRSRGSVQYGSVSLKPLVAEKEAGTASGPPPLLAPRTVTGIACRWQGPGRLLIRYRP